MQREGEVESISWRNRATKKPAPFHEPRSHPRRRRFKPLPGTDATLPPWGIEGCANGAGAEQTITLYIALCS